MINILYAALAIFLIIGLVLPCLVLDRLKKKHPQVWRELGSPSLFFNNSISNNIKTMRFIWRNEHRYLNDQYLNQIVALEKWLFLVYSISFAMFVAVLSFIEVVK